jgi:hypothetical protein
MRLATASTFLGALCVALTFAIPATSAAPREPAPVAAVKVAVFKAPVHKRCRCWGRVLSIRAIDATATAPASFEFLVRMHDGSLHTTSSTSLGRWKVGDRIMLFNGVQT